MNADDETLVTRWTRLARLQDVNDAASWEEFVKLYRPLVLEVAAKLGLRPDEAEDAAQETLKGIERDIGSLVPDSRRGSFKAWLRNRARWRALDQLRRRLPAAVGASAGGAAEDTSRTATVERVPDSREADLVRLCDEGQRRWRMAEALKELQRLVRSKHYLIFYQLIMEEKSVAEVAKLVGRTQTGVRVIKMRVSREFKKIYRRLEMEDEGIRALER